MYRVLAIILIIILALAPYTGSAQGNLTKDTIVQYKDILWNEQTLYAVGSDGKLSGWDLNNHIKKRLDIDPSLHITSINQDRTGSIFLGTNDGRLFRMDSHTHKLTLQHAIKKKTPILHILSNSANELFLILPESVYHPGSKRYWKKFTQYNPQINHTKKFLFFKKKTNKYFAFPQHAIIDSADVIWMSNQSGASGGELQRFDTKKTEPIEFPVSGLSLSVVVPNHLYCDAAGNVYISSGFTTGKIKGSLHQIKNSRAKLKLESRNFKSEYPKGIAIYSIVMDEKSSYIYIASNYGIHKSQMQQSGRIYNLETIFHFDDTWLREVETSNNEEIVVQQLILTNDGKLIILTKNNGIGIYHQGKLEILR